jgi:hypothetical protein
MNWDFCRIAWPNVAVIVALATVPFFAMALHMRQGEGPPIIQEIGVSPPLAMVEDR